MKEPFVLKSKVSITELDSCEDTQVYDPELQLWVSTISGRPLVVEMCACNAADRVNDIASASRRKSKSACYLSSSFGETSMTKTHEGVDQSGEVIHLTQFGETTLTETGEGVDVSESISDDRNAVDSYV